MENSVLFAEIAGAVDRRGAAVITSHVRPDGDSIGSSLALHAILASRGVRSQVVLDGDVPHRYRFLAGSEDVLPANRVLDTEGAVCIVLDTTSLERMGEAAALVARSAETIVIDHHPANSLDANRKWVDEKASAVGEMICRLATGMGWTIPPAACDGIFTAIFTDTGRFSFSNSTPTALRCAAEAVAGGADPERVASNVYASKTPGQWSLEARARSSLQLAAEGRIATMGLTIADFAETGTNPFDAHDFASLPRTLIGVRIGLFLYEADGGAFTRVNVRTDSSVDASALAGRFGGGGHARASGCTVEGGLAEARERVVEAASGFLAKAVSR